MKNLETADRLVYFSRANEIEKVQSPAVSGFDKIGIDDETIKNFWSEDSGFYPKGWIKGAVSSIRYKGGKKEAPADYGENIKKASASADKTVSMDGTDIEFYESRGFSGWSDVRDGVGFLDMVFAHELGHANDWERSRNLSRKQRAELLAKVIERMKNPDHFKTVMEAINNSKSYHSIIENADDKKKVYLQATEYFAQLCSGYFTTSDYMAEYYPDDYQIVDDLVHSTDESFNPIKVEGAKKEFVDKNFADSAKK